MANYATLKAAIAAAIKQNGNNEITGNLLQQQLLAMVNSLGAGYQYAGTATPETEPGTSDQNVFYLASTDGTYTNFGGLVLADGEIAILKYNGAWSKDSTGVASLEKVNRLGQTKADSKFFNLADPSKFVSGYIDYRGRVVASSGYVTTEYIPVLVGQTYYPAKDSLYDDLRFVAILDANKDILQHLENQKSITIPQGGAFIRVSFRVGNPRKQIAEVLSDWLPYTPISGWAKELENTVNSLKTIRLTKNISYISDYFFDNQYYDNNTGTPTNSTAYARTTYIPVDESLKYEFSGFSANGCFCFDENKTFLGKVVPLLNTVSLLPNTAYIGFNFQKAYMPADYKEKGVIFNIEPYVPMPTSDLKKVVKLARNIHYISDYFVDNQYYSTATGQIVGSSTYARTDYIPAEAGILYTISGFIASYCVCFDEDKNYLGQAPSAGDIVTPLENTAYIGFNFVKANMPVDYKEKGMVYNIDPFSSGDSGAGNILYGKKWCIVGDSFSQFSSERFTSGRFTGQYITYRFIIAERNNMLLADMAASGRTMAYPNDHTFDNAFAKPSVYQSIPEDVDYITIMLGINDAGHYARYSPDGESVEGYITLGDIDSVDTGSFYGAWNVVMDWIFTNRPNAHVGIIITNGLADQFGQATEKQMQIYQALLDICEKWNVPHINLNGGDGKTPMMHRGIYPQGTPASLIAAKWNAFATSPVEPFNGHTNANGHRYESTFIEEFLRSL